MSFLHEAGAEHFGMIQVDSGAMPPRFYMGKWKVYHIDDRSVAENRRLRHGPVVQPPLEYRGEHPPRRFKSTRHPFRESAMSRRSNPAASTGGWNV